MLEVGRTLVITRQNSLKVKYVVSEQFGRAHPHPLFLQLIISPPPPQVSHYIQTNAV